MAAQVLSDKDLRARYDQFGEAGVKGAGGAPNMQDFDLGDIFETFFGGQAGAAGQRRRNTIHLYRFARPPPRILRIRAASSIAAFARSTRRL